MEEDGQEKSLEPTERRLEQARQDGDVPQSRDLAAVAQYLALLVALSISAGNMALGFSEPLSILIRAPETMAGRLLGPGGPALAMELFGAAMLAIAPIFVLPMIATLVVLFAQRAIVFAPSKIEPKLSRIDPITQAGQKFGPTGLVEFAKSVVKLIAISAILGAVFFSMHDGVAAMVLLDPKALPELLLHETMVLLAATTVIAGVIAAIDVQWQQYDHRRKLRMSFQEMKEEARETEGDPTMKMTRRQKGREIAMNRMLEEVPNADVVVVNPTHYAVALKWSRMPGSAPVCVA
ncbi:MAG: EscU/YscU/HrcU family type III secretion system export apparatus switch protein, partial [Pseudomonadota bacterium]